MKYRSNPPLISRFSWCYALYLSQNSIVSFSRLKCGSLRGSGHWQHSNRTAVSVEGGKPVSGAWISAVRIDASDRALTQHVLSATDGTFSLVNLPAGRYRLCFQLPMSEYLNPCVWSVQQNGYHTIRWAETTGAANTGGCRGLSPGAHQRS